MTEPNELPSNEELQEALNELFASAQPPAANRPESVDLAIEAAKMTNMAADMLNQGQDEVRIRTTLGIAQVVATLSIARTLQEFVGMWAKLNEDYCPCDDCVEEREGEHGQG